LNNEDGSNWKELLTPESTYTPAILSDSLRRNEDGTSRTSTLTDKCSNDVTVSTVLSPSEPEQFQQRKVQKYNVDASNVILKGTTACNIENVQENTGTNTNIYM
jgi:hypothetical protein